MITKALARAVGRRTVADGLQTVDGKRAPEGPRATAWNSVALSLLVKEVLDQHK
jgi:hypothetical protein